MVTDKTSPFPRHFLSGKFGVKLVIYDTFRASFYPINCKDLRAKKEAEGMAIGPTLLSMLMKIRPMLNQSN